MAVDKLVFSNGSATVNRWKVQDIHITHSFSNFNQTSSFPTSRDDEFVRLHFGLNGKYSFHHNQLQRTFTNIEGRHNIMYSKGFDIEVNNESLDLETFGIQFPKELFLKYTSSSNELLKRFSENVLEGKSVLLSEDWKHIDYPTQQVIQQIIHCEYTGDLKDLFLLSKSLELLVIACEAHSQKLFKKTKFIQSPAEKDRLHDVKELILARISDPPHLSEIAKLVGLNEYKLKGGFKELFGTTIFGFLRDERLKLAHQYLINTQKNITEISDELGYSSPQHFSKAFKQRFKQTPLSIRKNP